MAQNRPICSGCMRELPDENVKFCPHCGMQQGKASKIHHLPAGTVLHDKIVIESVIGEGGFGITYRCRDRILDIPVAVKEYYPHGYVYRIHTVSPQVLAGDDTEKKVFFERGRARFLQEARVLARFSGEEGIVSVHDFFQENNTAYIVMEYLDGETLKHYVQTHGVPAPDGENRRLPAKEALRLLLPVADTLRVLHGQGVIHRDVSPDNIMIIGNRKVKLLDFGAARDVAAELKTRSMLVKPHYTPIEQYSRQDEQGPWTDVYALCATFYMVITGQNPPEAPARTAHDPLQTPSALGIALPAGMERAILKGLGVLPQVRYQTIDALLADLNTESDDRNDRSGPSPLTVTKTATRVDLDHPPEKKDKHTSAAPAPTARDAAPRSDSASPALRQPKHKNLWLMIALLSVAVIAVGALTAVLLSRGSGEDPGTTAAEAAGTAEGEKPAADVAAPEEIDFGAVNGLQNDVEDAQALCAKLGLSDGSIQVFRNVRPAQVEKWISRLQDEGYTQASRFPFFDESEVVLEKAAEKQGFIAGFLYDEAQNKTDSYAVLNVTGPYYDEFIGYDVNDTLIRWSNSVSNGYCTYTDDRLYTMTTDEEGNFWLSGMDFDGGNLRPLYQCMPIFIVPFEDRLCFGIETDTSGGEWNYSHSQYYSLSPDGEATQILENVANVSAFAGQLLYVSYEGNDASEVRLCTPDGSNARTLLEASAYYAYPVGHLLFYQDDADNETEYVFDLLTGEKKQLTTESAHFYTTDGKTARYLTPNPEKHGAMILKTMAIDGSNVKTVISSAATNFLAVSEDLVFFEQDGTAIPYRYENGALSQFRSELSLWYGGIYPQGLMMLYINGGTTGELTDFDGNTLCLLTNETN